MFRKVWDYIEQNNMIKKGDRIVIGVSGGADSVCLLYVLSEICRHKGNELFAVHVNHGIRGEEAKRDEQFVEEISKRLGITYHSFSFDVKKIAGEEGLSEEEAGRKVRYQSFTKVCRWKQCNKIAIAHNRNDNAETVLFHLFRGSGIRGLAGIDPVRTFRTDKDEITYIRPLLCVSRQQIEGFLKEREISYQTDATNLTDDYSRNKIRNQVLSYVTKEINTNAVTHIAGTAQQLKEIHDYMEHQIAERYSAVVEEREPFMFFINEAMAKEDIVIQRGILRKAMEVLAGNLKDLEAKHVEQVLSLYKKQVGKRVDLPYGMAARREYEGICLYNDKRTSDAKKYSGEQMETVVLSVPGRVYLHECRKVIEISIINSKKNEPIPKNSCTKWFDYDKIENAVVIRNREAGDYIQVHHTGGRKKLKDYFIDQKIPREERSKKLLIADGSHIMWILGDGDRISEKYKVDENTKNILLVKLLDAEE